MNTSPHQIHTCKSQNIKQFWNMKTLHFTVSYHSYTTLLLQKNSVDAHTTSNNDNVTVLNETYIIIKKQFIGLMLPIKA